MTVKHISILGSTGSIGVSTLDVIASHPDIFKVDGLAAGSNVGLLASQVAAFSPTLVSVKDEVSRSALIDLCGDKVEIVVGTEGASRVATLASVDTVLSSMVGAVGLKPTYDAIWAGKNIALANKETLVAAGGIMMRAARVNNVTLLPVDSEHSAIFQSLEGHRKEDVGKLILTASGGPFWNFDGNFEDITVEQALKHPNWSMGNKITIDSATMMNKGLEIIEACWLFGLPEDKIEVLIHPQSIVHSMVEYKDGSIVAQMAMPDMRGPISYALAYPNRVENNAEFVDWAQINTLTFASPDDAKFPMLKLARQAMKIGGSTPAVMNAANEIAVEAFLNKKIKFTDIHKTVSNAVEAHKPAGLSSIEAVLEFDKEGRRLAREIIGKL